MTIKETPERSVARDDVRLGESLSKLFNRSVGRPLNRRQNRRRMGFLSSANDGRRPPLLATRRPACAPTLAIGLRWRRSRQSDRPPFVPMLHRPPPQAHGVRRSIDSGPAIPAALLKSLHRRFGNPHPNSISSDGALGRGDGLRNGGFSSGRESDLTLILGDRG